jgi:anti-anti-sigma factor
MKISVADAGSTATVVLDGRLDIAGADAVAAPLAKLADEKLGLIVDLSRVSFLASVGIRHLMAAAKTLTRRGGRLVLLKPTALVEEMLITTGMNSLIPITRSEREAQAVLTAALQE